jgi:serine phosphatase RsbU (regulator of sigma subunit)
VSRLFAKTLLVTIVLFAVIAAASSGRAAWNLNLLLTREYQSKGTALARSLADSSGELLAARALPMIQSSVDQFETIEGVAYLFVGDASGDIVAHTFVPGIPEAAVRFHQEVESRGLHDEVVIRNLEVEGFSSVIAIAAPVLSGSAGYAHVGMDRGLIRARIRSVILQQFALVLVVFLLAALAAWVLVKRISRPLNLLAEHARTLATADFSAGSQVASEIEDLSRRQHDEIGELAASFVYMEQTLERYLADLRETTAAKERIESELAIARDIQMNMVPKQFPPFPDRNECDLFATLEPAREVGGDFYDYAFIARDRLFLAIGDVSGKGVPAALFMATTRTLLRATIGRLHDPEQIMARLNDIISRDNASAMFVTLFIAVLDVSTGRLQYCNGGHNLPYVLSGGRARPIENTPGALVGAFEGARYQGNVIQLDRGDGLVLYTDGVTEAMNVRGQQFSDQRLEEFLASAGRLTSEELTQRLLAEVRRFADGAPQSDDITIVTLQYAGG